MWSYGDDELFLFYPCQANLLDGTGACIIYTIKSIIYAGRTFVFFCIMRSRSYTYSLSVWTYSMLIISYCCIAPRRQALIFACLDRCSPSRHTAGSRNNVANIHVCFAGHMFQGRITSKRQCMHAYKQRCETCRPNEERVDIQNHDDMHGCLASTYISGIGKYSHDDFHGRRNMVCMLWSSRWQERRGAHAMIFTLTGTWCARESKHVELDIPLLVNHLTARLSYIHPKHIWQVSKRSL